MIKNWDRKKIEQDIWKIASAASDPRMDGFTTWGCKQDLILLKYFIDDMLEECPTYSLEKEFINNLEAERTFALLKKEKHR
jgi:hypothetical protein